MSVYWFVCLFRFIFLHVHFNVTKIQSKTNTCTQKCASFRKRKKVPFDWTKLQHWKWWHPPKRPHCVYGKTGGLKRGQALVKLLPVGKFSIQSFIRYPLVWSYKWKCDLRRSFFVINLFDQNLEQWTCSTVSLQSKAVFILNMAKHRHWWKSHFDSYRVAHSPEK